MANNHGDFLWYELMTTDANAAQSFYGPLLGWEFSSSGQEGMDYRTFAKGSEGIGGLMTLSPEMQDGGARPLWAGYVTVDDVDASAARIAQLGGTVMMEPQDIPGVGRFAFAADPSGAPFYIMKGSVAGGETTSFAKYQPREGHCAWNELATADPSGAHDFYTALFGWEKADTMDMGDMGAYDMYSNGDYTLGAIMRKPDQMPVSQWSFYFRVSSIAAAADYVKSHGGKIINGPMEIPGGDHVFTAIDPQGATFDLIGKKD